MDSNDKERHIASKHLLIELIYICGIETSLSMIHKQKTIDMKKTYTSNCINECFDAICRLI